jgi:hypothetical protein
MPKRYRWLTISLSHGGLNPGPVGGGHDPGKIRDIAGIMVCAHGI